MRRLRRWRRMFLARLAVELGVLLLIATAVNVPLGVILLKGREGKIRSYPISLRDAEAAQRRWPWATPSQHPPWPAPTSFDRADVWGYSSFDVRHHGGKDQSYAMDLETGGWPLRVVGVPQYWYPGSLQRVTPDPGIQLNWPGVILNPPIVAGTAWVLFIAPFEAFFAVRWRWRLRRRLCPYCAYPAGQADVCTECGRSATLPLRV